MSEHPLLHPDAIQAAITMGGAKALHTLLNAADRACVRCPCWKPDAWFDCGLPRAGGEGFVDRFCSLCGGAGRITAILADTRHRGNRLQVRGRLDRGMLSESSVLCIVGSHYELDARRAEWMRVHTFVEEDRP